MDMGGMDAADQTVVVGCVVTVAIAAVIMAIMKYSFTSQEHQVSEHLSTLYGSNPMLKTKAEKAAEKKRRAKQAKAALAKSAAPVDEKIGDYAHHHVEINPNHYIIPGTDSIPAPEAKPKLKKRQNSKPILHNKDEVPLVTDADITVRDVFTKSTVPKDDAELRHDKLRTGPSQVREPVVKTTFEEPEIEEEIIAVTQSTNQHSAPNTNQQSVPTSKASKSAEQSELTEAPTKDNPKKIQKKSKLKSNTTTEDVTVEDPVDIVVATISQSGLTETQLQKLITALVNKHATDRWVSKADEEACREKYTKQIQALQVTLDTEREKLMWTNEKMKELSTKLSLSDRNHMNAAKQAQEMQRRLQQMSEQHRAEVTGIQTARYQEAQRMQQHLQQISEENASLRQALPNTDEVVQMRNQLRALEAEMQDHQRQLVKSEAKNQELTQHLNSANSTYRQESVRNAEMSNRIEELTYNKSRLEGELSETQGRVRTAESDLRNLQDHLKNKDLEIKALHSEILSAKQATTETISSTSEADNSKIQHLESTVVDLNKTIATLQEQIENLHSQLSQTKDELDKAYKSHSNGAISGSGDNEADEKKIWELEDKVVKVQSELEALKDKNNELRKKNWILAESLEKAETAAASAKLLEAELEKKNSTIHELKALNHTLSVTNNDNVEKIEQLHSSVSHMDELRQELSHHKQSLVDKDEVIHQLELSLSDERDKVSATESECKHLLENELHKSMAVIEDKHRSRIDELQSKLSQSDSRIADLARLLQKAETIIKQIGHNADRDHTKLNGSVETQELQERLRRAEDVNLRLQSRLNKLIESTADSEERSDGGDKHSRSVTEDQVRAILKSLNPSVSLDTTTNVEQSISEFYEQTTQLHDDKSRAQYKQALEQAEEMLDRLSVTWQQKLDKKEVEINRLQVQLDKYLQPGDEIVHNNDSHVEVFNAGVVNTTSQEVIQLARSGSLQDVSSTV